MFAFYTVMHCSPKFPLHEIKNSLTLSLPIFWQFCSLSATFILTARGILESQAYKFSKILFFLPFLLITFNKYPQFEVSKSRILWTLHNICKQRASDIVRGGGLSCRSTTSAVCYDVADRRPWSATLSVKELIHWYEKSIGVIKLTHCLRSH